MLSAARAAAKKRGQSCTISRKDIRIPKICPILGIKLQNSDGPRKDDTPSLDRINNTKGYTPGNIHIVSWRANDLKRNAALDELIQLGRWAAQQKGKK